MDEVRVRILISGQVQGVFFRASTKQEAVLRGLKGWARNLSSGQVEAVFQGPSSEVDSMIQWCHQGPPAARVTRIVLTWEEPNPSETCFQILYV